MARSAPTATSAPLPDHAAPMARPARDIALPLLLCTLAILGQLPALYNAAGAHADAAIVGLQALHILRGEPSWFIWGTNYQGTLDALLSALGFAVTGPRPLTLMLVPLCGHLLLIGLTFATLRRHLAPLAAAVATLPVVFTPTPINGVILYPPRQWAITAVVAAVWLLDGASRAHRPRARLALGSGLAIVALYLDLFTFQFLPALALLALACCQDDAPARPLLRRRIGACALGAAGGATIFALSRLAIVPGVNTVEANAVSLATIRRNATLLWGDCLPLLLSVRVYIPGARLYPERWQAPVPFGAIQLVGASLLLAGIAFGGAALLLHRLPWPLRRLGGFGALVAATTLLGFLVSGSPIDLWAARYLAPIVWAAPFAIAPAARLLGGRRFLLALAPYALATIVGGWLSFGPYVQGLRPVHDARGAATEEAALGAALRERGVRYGAAQYWLAYRLTFLWREAPIVVPTDPGSDRYAPYRAGYGAAPIRAYIFTTDALRGSPEPCEGWLRGADARYERVTVPGFVALVWWRDGATGEATGCVAAIPQQSAPSAKK
jgi:hypothetical protein